MYPKLYEIKNIPPNVRYININEYSSLDQIAIFPPGIYKFLFSDKLVKSYIESNNKYFRSVSGSCYEIELATPYQIFIKRRSDLFYFWSLTENILDTPILPPLPNIDMKGLVCLGSFWHDTECRSEIFQSYIGAFFNNIFNDDILLVLDEYYRHGIRPFCNFLEWAKCSDNDPDFCLKTRNYIFYSGWDRQLEYLTGLVSSVPTYIPSESVLFD